MQVIVIFSMSTKSTVAYFIRECCNKGGGTLECICTFYELFIQMDLELDKKWHVSLWNVSLQLWQQEGKKKLDRVKVFGAAK